MNPDFARVLTASAADRRALFVETGRRLGTTEVNVEKDFWVCWTLDALFNAMPPEIPRLLFKGGTSLSKAYGLIDRFSEDVDVTVYRDDLGQRATTDEMEGLSRKQRRRRLEAIRERCAGFVSTVLRDEVARVMRAALETAGMPGDAGRVEVDADDLDAQTLLIHYPTVTVDEAAYVRRSVKIESGAKSALDPHSPREISPYVAGEVPALDLHVGGVTTIDAERTFWDKVVILHGLRTWYYRKGRLRQEGERISRHYYDLHRLLQSPAGRAAADDLALGAECVRHARMFFHRPDYGLEWAEPGTFTLVPDGGMYDALEGDYRRMAEMIFGEVPPFRDVVRSVGALEVRLNDEVAVA